MSEMISWNLSIQVAGGPRLAAAQAVAIDAYDVVDVEIPNGAAGKDVEVQPGDTDHMRLLFIAAAAYGKELTYAVNGNTVALDAPHLFVGGGAVGLFGADPKTLHFTNQLADGKPVSIRVLVGRTTTA